MEYFYFFENASLSVCVIEYLAKQPNFPLDYVSVLYIANNWLIRAKFLNFLRADEEANYLAVMSELGYPYTPTTPMTLAFACLAAGAMPTEVMSRHQIEFIAHGKPEREDIEFFRQRLLQASGYYPNSLR